MARDKTNIPKADILMGSLRSMGYSFESAIADVIDNSVSARATNIHIMFPTNPLEEMAVGILDDGIGMTSDELFEAMRYGSSASEEVRDVDDLGRFGLGLKAASLSQCRKLTVISVKEKKLSGLSWDYNYILQKKDWIVRELTIDEIRNLPYSDKLISLSECKNGTLVIWQDFDMLSKSSDGQVYECLNELREKVDFSVSLIFHRFITSKFHRISFYVNQHKVKALDPFLENHPKTTLKKERTIALLDSKGVEQIIKVKPFILPFATDLSESDKKQLGGLENMRSQQGFYVYRNNRLIIWGTWFNMKPRGELTKNARIRVDIPNTLDDIWSIDIKKQTATIPKRILNQLKKTVMDAIETSVNKHTYRGRTNKIDDETDYIWDRVEGRDKNFFYQINRESKLFQFVRNKMSDSDYDYLEMLVTEIENNIPTQQMYIDKSNEVITEKENNSRLDDVFQIAVTMVSSIQSSTLLDVSLIISNLMKSEPFCKYEELREMLTSNFEKHDD